MSKIGEKPIHIAEGANVTIEKDRVTITGPGGELSYRVPKGITLKKEGDTVKVEKVDHTKKMKALHGLWRSLIANAVEGVVKSWTRSLEVVGTGYNVKLQGQDLVFKVGYSHPVTVSAIPGITFEVSGNNIVIVKGADKQLVGQVAQKIKVVKKPDAYKGKGIKYEGEKLRIKPGKKAKAAGA